MHRLSVVDEIFLRAHHGMGTPIALQGLWRTADRVDRALLERTHEMLRTGPLGRRVVRSRVPGARPYWQRSVRAHPFDYISAPIPAAEVLAWADTRGDDLDPEHGPGWRLSATAVDDGGTVVALTCSHVLADARGLILAVEDALEALNRASVPPGRGNAGVGDSADGPGFGYGAELGEPYPGGEDPYLGNPPGGTSVRPVSAGAGTPGTDWGDARRQWSVVVGGTVRALSGDIVRFFRSPGSAWGADADRGDRGCPASATGRWTVGSPPVHGLSGLPVGSPTGIADQGGAATSGASARSSIGDRDKCGPPARVVSVEALGADEGGPWDRGVSAGAPAGDACDPGAGVSVRPSTGPIWRSGSVRTTALPVTGVVLRCSVNRWDRVAAEHGGTANSLFVWFVAHTLWASGFPARGIEASLPVDTRAEPRIDNDLAMTGITVDPDDGPAEVRTKCRLAYRRRISSPGGLPEEILQVVPDRLAYLMSRGAGERDILCSNIGPFPSRLLTLGPYPCTGVATRAIHPGLTVARRPRTHLLGYLCRTPDEYSLTLAGLDPDRIPSDSALRVLAHRTAAQLTLPVTSW
ncbi:hypothetical protein [Nocardia brevicatena]|uniref:hypothetical protein n=1 Tax=Nocardia brevicatena TaxID=37327 RepID=UPI0002E72EE5|nr:hypothetical protein [Nocardia brevicatena]